MFAPRCRLAVCKVDGRKGARLESFLVKLCPQLSVRWKTGPGRGLCKELVYLIKKKGGRGGGRRGQLPEVMNFEPAVFLLLMDAEARWTSLFSVPAVSAPKKIANIIPWNINKVELPAEGAVPPFSFSLASQCRHRLQTHKSSRRRCIAQDGTRFCHWIQTHDQDLSAWHRTEVSIFSI